MPSRPLSLAATALLTAALAACASTGGPDAAPDAADDRVEAAPYAELVIDNDNPRIVTVYAIRAGQRRRLGTVSGVSTQTFAIERHMLDTTGELQVLVEPLGSSNRYTSDKIFVAAGDVIELSVSGLVR